MKNLLRHLFLLSCCVAAFTSCNYSDTSDIPVTRKETNIVFRTENAVIIDNHNQVMLSYVKMAEAGINVLSTWVSIFTDGVCTETWYTDIYANSKAAQKAYEEMVEGMTAEEIRGKYTVNKNEVRTDMTKEYEGMTKEQVMERMRTLAENLGTL